jgi:hypothetical protein
VDSFDGPQTLFLFCVDLVIDGQPPCWSLFVASTSAGLPIFRQRRHSQHILLGFILRRRLAVDGQRLLLDSLMPRATSSLRPPSLSLVESYRQ